jgi:hypothetical protein
MTETHFDIKATPLTNGDINIDVDMVTADADHVEAREALSRQVLKTTEESTKQALMALGWTPPDGEAPIVADIPMLVDAIIGKGFNDDHHRKMMMVHGLANKDGWDRVSLGHQSKRKLLAIYTRGENV